VILTYPEVEHGCRGCFSCG